MQDLYGIGACKIFVVPETNFKTLKHRVIGIAIATLPAVIIILQNETGLALVYISFFCDVPGRLAKCNPGHRLFSGCIGLGESVGSSFTLFFILTAVAIAAILMLRKRFMKDGALRLIIIGSYAAAILFSQVAIPLAFKKVLQGYQIERIYSMLGQEVPETYAKANKPTEEQPGKKKDNNYNVTQSKIAIGSGGFAGKGFLNGTSTKNDFVPEQHTDFIFCSIGEQFGFLGSLVLIALYVALMIRITILAERQRSPFSRIYAYCVAAILFFHFAVNISMTIGLAPVIGITLPFLSYGGSSLLSFSILVFILLRLDADRHVLIR